MRKKAKRILAMALSVVMLLGVMPTQAFAANTADTAGLLAPQQISDSGAASDEEEEETVIISPPADPEEGETETSPGISGEDEKETSADETAQGETEQKAEEEKNPDENNTDSAGTDAGQTPVEEPASEPTIGASNEESSLTSQEDGASVHWLQQYQQAAMGAADMTMQRSRSARASSASPSYSMITWSGGQLEFANGAYLGSPMPKIYLNGEIAFCGEWNGEVPSGDYIQSGEGNDSAIKQILANYDKSGKSNEDYAAAQAAIWAHIMGTSVRSWGGCPGASSADEIFNGDADTSNIKYNYLSWTGGTQDLITYNTEEGPDPDPDPEIDPDDYPEDKYHIEVKTDTQTETEVRNRKTYEYSDAIGQITIRKHDENDKSLDGALVAEELFPPEGYVMAEKNTYDVTVAKGEHKTLDVPNDKKSMITIEKIDSVTLQPMEGVVFEVSIKNGKSLRDFTTDSSGKVVVEPLEPGQIYEVKEKRTLPGYLLDETVHEIKLDAAENPVLKLKNTPENPLIISKKDAVTGEPIPDTVFEVRHSDGRMVGEFTTGENGMAVVTGKDVVPGWYLVTEVRANPAYIATGEAKLVELKYEATAMVEFVNQPRTGLQIRKVDDVTGEPIPDVGFYIEEINGRTIGTYYTDDAGVINLSDQEEIWVRVTEIQPADGYKPDPTPRTMKLESGKLNIMEWRNQPWPTLKIVKLDADTKQPMEGVKIRVYDKFHREVGTYSTNSLGQIVLSGVDGGETLYLQEVETLPGYQLDEQSMRLPWPGVRPVQWNCSMSRFPPCGSLRSTAKPKNRSMERCSTSMTLKTI